MKLIINKLKKKSIGWWASFATIVALFVAFGNWFFPNVFANNTPSPTPTPIVSTLGIGGLINASPKPEPGKIRILIARFDEEDQENYKFTDLIVAKLREATKPYSDTEIVVINQKITELQGSEFAQEIGQTYGASIVVWGWYGLTDRAVPLGLHFEIIDTSSTFIPQTCAASRSQTRTAKLSEINDLTLQTSVSNELSYVTLFTLGLIRFEADDYQAALNLFEDAINRLDQQNTLSAKTSGEDVLVNKDTLYLYRALSYYELKNYEKSIYELEKLAVSYPDNSTIKAYLASALKEENKSEAAIEIYSTLIAKETNSHLKAAEYYSRGLIYETLGNYELANADFDQSGILNDEVIYEFVDFTKSPDMFLKELDTRISKNPLNALAYYQRGMMNYLQSSVVFGNDAVYAVNNPNDLFLKAYNDIQKTIKLNPKIIGARNWRAHMSQSVSDYDPKTVIDDLDVAFQLETYRVPCNYQNRGIAYLELGDLEKANNDFDAVIALTTQEIQSDPRNASAYFVRGLAYDTQEKYYKAFLQFLQVKRLDPVLAKTVDANGRMLDSISYYKYYVLFAVLAITFIFLAIRFAPSVVSAIKKKRKSVQKHLKHRPRKHKAENN